MLERRAGLAAVVTSGCSVAAWEGVGAGIMAGSMASREGVGAGMAGVGPPASGAAAGDVGS